MLPGHAKAAEIKKDIKDNECKRVFDSAPKIVEEVLLKEVAPGDLDLMPTLSSKVCLARQANRKRQKVRPDNPSDITFVLQSKPMASYRPTYSWKGMPGI